MATVVVPLLAATGAPAAASSPSNDDIANATAITSLPWQGTADLSQATWDYSADSSACHWERNHSVWYSFTPASDGQVAFDPSASNQSIAIDVFTGSPDALSWVGCGVGGPAGFNNGGVILNATSDTTYWIMASSIFGLVPILDLSVYRPQLAQASITVERGTVDHGGNVTVTGTLNCSGTVPTGVRIDGNVRQSVGRLASVTATFSTTVPCAGTQQWTALARPSAGRFAGGPATIDTTMIFCNLAGCALPNTTTILTLRR